MTPSCTSLSVRTNPPLTDAEKAERAEIRSSGAGVPPIPRGWSRDLILQELLDEMAPHDDDALSPAVHYRPHPEVRQHLEDAQEEPIEVFASEWLTMTPSSRARRPGRSTTRADMTGSRAMTC
jgi:hypothetical protein